MNRLGEQIENVEKRIKKIDADMKRLTMEALEKKKAKDTRGKPLFLINSDRCFVCIEKKANKHKSEKE